MTKQVKHANIKAAHELDFDIEKVKRYYSDWSKTYDCDVAEEVYFAPYLMVQILLNQLELLDDFPNKDELRILDAGCGTGLVGEGLNDEGFCHIYGFDISLEMVEKAAQRRVYRSLTSDVDLNQPLFPQLGRRDFDVALSVGVFTHGHVPPKGLGQLIDIVRTGGLIGVNARDSYAIERDFEAYCQTLVDSGVVKPLSHSLQRSTGDTDAIFVVFQKL